MGEPVDHFPSQASDTGRFPQGDLVLAWPANPLHIQDIARLFDQAINALEKTY